MPSVTFTDYMNTRWGAKYTDVEVNYTEDYTISTNTTRVNITSVRFRVQGDTNWGAQVIHGRVKINGNTVCSFSPGSSTATQIIVTGSYTTLSNGGGSWYYDIVHNNDGTGSFTLSLDESADAVYTNVFGFWYAPISAKIGVEASASAASKTVNLTTRPRVSSVSASNANFGSTSTITITRYSSSFTHTVTASCAGRTETVATKTSSTSLSWTPAVANFAPLITNAMFATATISCSTYSGNTLIGTSTTTCTLSFTAASVAPSVSISYSDPMGYASTYGKYIKSKSKYAITLSVTLQYGATRSSGSVTANGSTYSYTGSTITTGVISSTSNTTITASVTDSRGQTATASVTGIQIYDYSPPAITSISAVRCDSSGVLNNTGGYYKINYTISVTSLGSRNTRTLTPAYKKVTQSTYTNQTAITPSSYTATGTAPASGVYTADINSSYDIKVVLSDAFGSVTAYTSLPTSETRMNWGQGQNGGVAIGKVSEYNKTFEIASGWDIKFHTPLPVSSGGTGASTAAGARANLETFKRTVESYPAIVNPDGTNSWIKIGTSNTSYGLLPSQSGAKGSGHNSLGTSSWYWKYAYIDNIYGSYKGDAVAVANGGTGATTAANARANIGAIAMPTVVVDNTTTTGETTSKDYTVSGSGVVIAFIGMYSDSTNDYGTFQADISYDGTVIMGNGTRWGSDLNYRLGASTSVPIAVTNGKKINLWARNTKEGTKYIYRRFICFGCTVS